MNKFSRAAKSTTAIFALLAAGLANATTYSNSFDGTIYYFGTPDTTSYGEVFKLTGADTLNDFTFYASQGVAGNLELVVASWDGTKAVGPALYTSAEFAYAGGAQTLAFSGINTSLAAGSYIAYMTVAGVSNPAASVGMKASNSDGGLGGSFAFLNSSGVDPLTLNQNWTVGWTLSNLQFTANFGAVAAVPEPETYAMLMAGLGLLGAVARRRKRAA